MNVMKQKLKVKWFRVVVVVVFGFKQQQPVCFSLMTRPDGSPTRSCDWNMSPHLSCCTKARAPSSCGYRDKGDFVINRWALYSSCWTPGSCSGAGSVAPCRIRSGPAGTPSWWRRLQGGSGSAPLRSQHHLHEDYFGENMLNRRFWSPTWGRAGLVSAGFTELVSVLIPDWTKLSLMSGFLWRTEPARSELERFILLLLRRTAFCFYYTIEFLK